MSILDELMGMRRKSRECSLQILYQIEFSPNRLRDALDLYWSENHENEEIREFTEILVEGTLRNQKEIDGIIESSSTNWKVSRMTSVDRNLLRQSIFELLYLKDIPQSVTINEAVEVAKRFGTEESSRFINGILDKVAQDHKKN